MYQNTSLHFVLDKITVDLNYNHNVLHFHNESHKQTVLFIGEKYHFQEKNFTVSFTEATKMKYNTTAHNCANKCIFIVISWLYSTRVAT